MPDQAREVSVIGGRAVWLGLALLVLGPLAAPSGANAELTQKGDLFIAFDGGIRPHALPRDHRAPIGISLTGTVRTLSGERPPALRAIRIELNRGGRIQTAGLPTCPRHRIEFSTRAHAMSVCGNALVGRGTYVARTAFPEQDTSPANGDILAFNSKTANGRSVILAHVYGSVPAPNTRIIVFRINNPRKGTYGTVLRGRLPISLNRWGYLRRISLRLHRTYTHRGRKLSYISAACEAPPRFPRATFPFARASMVFEDGRRLFSVISRTCTVRR